MLHQNKNKGSYILASWDQVGCTLVGGTKHVITPNSKAFKIFYWRKGGAIQRGGKELKKNLSQ